MLLSFNGYICFWSLMLDSIIFILLSYTSVKNRSLVSYNQEMLIYTSTLEFFLPPPGYVGLLIKTVFLELLCSKKTINLDGCHAYLKNYVIKGSKNICPWVKHCIPEFVSAFLLTVCSVSVCSCMRFCNSSEAAYVVLCYSTTTYEYIFWCELQERCHLHTSTYNKFHMWIISYFILCPAT